MIILRESPRDWLLVGAVALLTFGANLPDELTQYLPVDRRYMLGGLLALVTISMLRYLKFSLILAIGLLAAGANLPEEIAKEFNIDPQIALLGLVCVIVLALSNKLLRLPVGLEKAEKRAAGSAHGAAALFNAILKGRTTIVQSLITQGVNVNVRTVSGKTPLMAATFKGYTDIVQVLIEAGADPHAKDGRGEDALALATRGGFTRIVDILKKAQQTTRSAPSAKPAAAETAGAEPAAQ